VATSNAKKDNKLATVAQELVLSLSTLYRHLAAFMKITVSASGVRVRWVIMGFGVCIYCILGGNPTKY